MKFIVTLFLVVALADLFHCTPTDRKAVYKIDNSSPKDPEVKTRHESVQSLVTEESKVEVSTVNAVSLPESVPVKTNEEAKSPENTNTENTNSPKAQKSESPQRHNPVHNVPPSYPRQYPVPYPAVQNPGQQSQQYPQLRQIYPQQYPQLYPQQYPQNLDPIFVYPMTYPQAYYQQQQYAPGVEYSQLYAVPLTPNYSVLVL